MEELENVNLSHVSQRGLNDLTEKEWRYWIQLSLALDFLHKPIEGKRYESTYSLLLITHSLKII